MVSPFLIHLINQPLLIVYSSESPRVSWRPVGLSLDLGLAVPGKLPVVVHLSFSRWNIPNRAEQSVVPLGFVILVPALALRGGFEWRRSSMVYGWLLVVLVTGLSYGAWQWLERNPQWMQSGHSHGDHASGVDVTALQATRVVEVRMDDKMRFYPDQLESQAGQAVRLVVHNAGRLPHEQVLGSAEQIREHAQQMKQGQAHAHNHGAAGAAAIEVEPGKTGELVLRFAQPGRFEMARLIPGHYEAGMRGRLTVVPASASSAGQPAVKSGGHDHSSHKH